MYAKYLSMNRFVCFMSQNPGEFLEQLLLLSGACQAAWSNKLS
jgi:hypothetical protein